MARILVIEDDDDFRRMLNVMLSGQGFEVIEASNGEEGIKAYDKDQIDLVITDILMPAKEGKETILELQEINPEVNIIAISGGGTQRTYDYLDWMKDFGTQYVFKKPFNSKVFLDVVKKLLESK